jgi:hypothetical protein
MRAYKKFACAFKNEADAEDELDEEAGMSLEEAETEYFEEKSDEQN